MQFAADADALCRGGINLTDALASVISGWFFIDPKEYWQIAKEGPPAHIELHDARFVGSWPGISEDFG